MFRGFLFALIGIALVTVAFRFVELAGLAPDLRPPGRVTTVFLALSLYAATLSAYVAWRLPGRTEARWFCLAFAMSALVLAAGVTPTGSGGPIAQVTVAVGVITSLACVIQFASRFPVKLDSAAFQGERPPATSPLEARVDGLLEPLSRLFLTRPWVVWALLAACVPLNYLLFQHGAAYRYNMMYANAQSPLLWLATIRVLALGVAMAFPVALVWSGYRRATKEARRQSQWIVLGALFVLFWFAFTFSVYLLARSLDFAVMQAVGRAVNLVSLQVFFFVVITAPAVALLYGGALDLRPVIQRTSLYGLTLLTLTVLFTGVEQLVSSQLVDRLGLPAGTGSWLGGVTVALALMPLQDRIRRWLRRFGS